MKYIVDIDGTICQNNSRGYFYANPFKDRIKKINRLYDEGNTIIYWTARGGNTGIDYSELTKQQLNVWGCKYHELHINKPVYDIWIDDKAVNSEDYFNEKNTYNGI